MTMKERINATVAQKLSGAVDGEAKSAIIEELSGNLCAKYDDLVAQGVDPEEAYEIAVDSIGDVGELVELAGGTTGKAEVQKAVDATVTMGKEIAHKLKGPAKELWGGMKQAAHAAADAVKNLEITVDIEKSGHQFDYTVPGDDITGLELRLRSGDVVIHLWDEDSIQVIERSARAFSSGPTGCCASSRATPPPGSCSSPSACLPAILRSSCPGGCGTASPFTPPAGTLPSPKPLRSRTCLSAPPAGTSTSPRG